MTARELPIHGLLRERQLRVQHQDRASERSGSGTADSTSATSAPTLSARMLELPNHVFVREEKPRKGAHARVEVEQAHDPTMPDKRHVVVRCATVQADHELLHPRWFGRFRTALACRHESSPRNVAKHARVALWLGLLLAGATGCGLQSESRAQNGQMSPYFFSRAPTARN